MASRAMQGYPESYCQAKNSTARTVAKTIDGAWQEFTKATKNNFLVTSKYMTLPKLREDVEWLKECFEEFVNLMDMSLYGYYGDKLVWVYKTKLEMPKTADSVGGSVADASQCYMKIKDPLDCQIGWLVISKYEDHRDHSTLWDHLPQPSWRSLCKDAL